MAGLIELEGMEFYAFHGYYPSEKQIGNRFVVSVKIATDCTLPGETDQLEDALNYQEVYHLVKKEMAVSSNLLEHVCSRILTSLYKAFPGIEEATVKISKINPPMGGSIEKVSLSLTK